MKLRWLTFGAMVFVSLFVLGNPWAAPDVPDDKEEGDLVWIDPSAGEALRGEDDQTDALDEELLETLGRHWLTRNHSSVPSGVHWLPLVLSGGRILSFDSEWLDVQPVTVRGEPIGSPVRLPMVRQRDQRHFEIDSDRPEPVIVTVEFIELTPPADDADEEELAYHQRALDLVRLLNER